MKPNAVMDTSKTNKTQPARDFRGWRLNNSASSAGNAATCKLGSRDASTPGAVNGAAITEGSTETADIAVADSVD